MRFPSWTFPLLVNWNGNLQVESTNQGQMGRPSRCISVMMTEVSPFLLPISEQHKAGYYVINAPLLEQAAGNCVSPMQC